MLRKIGDKSAVAAVLCVLLSTSQAAAQADEMAFQHAIALGDLLHAEEADTLLELETLFPDLRHIPSNPLPETLVGDQYFHIFMEGEDDLSALRCIRIGTETQAALIREIGHPLRGYFYTEMHSIEMKDVGDHDVIMDCYVNVPEDTYRVPLAINYLAQNEYELDIMLMPEHVGGHVTDNEPYQLLFEMSEETKTAPGLIRGRIESGGSQLMLWFRFVKREELIG